MNKLIAKVVDIKLAVTALVVVVGSSLDEVKDRAIGIKGLIIGAGALAASLVVESVKSAVEEIRSPKPDA